jgi:excisionase family DNA binding protein
MSEQPFLSTDDVAAALGLSRHTVCRYVKLKKIPSIRLGRKLLIPSAWLDGVLENARKLAE